MDILRLFSGKRGALGSEGVQKENRSYDELMDEITDYHVRKTSVLEILREKISEETLKQWSEALNRGTKRGMARSASPENSDGDQETMQRIYRFILDEKINLLSEPSMKNAKGMGAIDPISVCIVCGVRALQSERGLQGLMSTLKFKVMERYFA